MNNTTDQSVLLALLDALRKQKEEKGEEEDENPEGLAIPGYLPSLSSTPMTPAPRASARPAPTSGSSSSSGGFPDLGGGGIGLPGLTGMGGGETGSGIGLPGLGGGLLGLGGGLPGLPGMGNVGQPERKANGEIDWQATGQKGTTTLANFLGPLNVNDDGGSFDKQDWMKAIVNALIFYFSGGYSSMTNPTSWYDYAQMAAKAYDADQVYNSGRRGGTEDTLGTLNKWFKWSD